MLFSLARGWPIVTEEWLYECLEKGCWVNPYCSLAQPRISSSSSGISSVQHLHPRYAHRALTHIRASHDALEDLIAVNGQLKWSSPLFSKHTVYLGAPYDIPHMRASADPSYEVLRLLVVECGGKIANKKEKATITISNAVQPSGTEIKLFLLILYDFFLNI